MISLRHVLVVLASLPGLFSGVRSYAGEKPPDMEETLLKQVKWRSIGPANMGGRVADIAADPTNPFVYYVALATGGLLKTANNGQSWTPLFDNQPVASIGAVAVALPPPAPKPTITAAKPTAPAAKTGESKPASAPESPPILWVGTGEANGRNSSSWGDGVYKSVDGGTTWTHMGLRETQEIGRIVIDPKDSNTVYVAAAGRLWGPNKERGVFKTTDGGKTWKHTLAIDPDTGAIDLALGEPGVVFAAAYQRRRHPWGFDGFGPGSAVYKSTDSGSTWKNLGGGLPGGGMGRIGLSVCGSKPNIVYAVIESMQGGTRGISDDRSKYGGVFRSNDSGETWKRVNPNVPRGFYFGQIRVDPQNPERVYVLGYDLSLSEDGGATFKSSSARVHSDLHALWIDPNHTDRLILGTDGGIYVSYDRAKTWTQIDNYPMGEFYEVAFDNRQPYWLYGGLQDNANWAGPSALDANVGPGNADWVLLGGGDGFYAMPDPVDPDIVYFESQGGDLGRVDRRTNFYQPMAPRAQEGVPAFRFNWNAPVAISHFDHDVVYLGGNRLFRFTKRGADWEAISPDLSKQRGAQITAGGSGAETYGTLTSLAESPVQKGLLWTGTDDGDVQITQDNGATWTDLTANLPHKVRDYYVKRIEASRRFAGRAYLAVDGHRSDDLEPYLFVTEDAGKSWKSIAGDLPKQGPVKAIREDPVNPDLLFAGTEFGAFASFDRGTHWHKLSGLPTVAVDDLQIHPGDHALIAATHGRSLWVIDNIAPLEDLSPKIRESEVYLFSVQPGRFFLPAEKEWFTSSGFRAENRPAEVEIVYWLKNLAEEAPKVSITDSAGKAVADLSGERYPGIDRVRWDMKQKPPAGVRRDTPRFVKPGTYTVTLTVGKTKLTQPVTIGGNPELAQPHPGDEDAPSEGRRPAR